MPAPPGTRKPLTSQGCTPLPPFRIHCRARSMISAAGATSLTRPFFSASCGPICRPSLIRRSASVTPIIRGVRCVPPAPGSRPIFTSGKPTPAFGPSSITR